jgi:regulation of enolase protein 1 (concanavalin A-like superfamily)
LTGTGNGFWGNADSCHALTQRIDGNATIVVKVVSQTNTDPWATAGLTLRNSMEPGSPQAGVFLTGSNGAAFFRRSVLNQPSAYTAGRRSAAAPRWLKLERSGEIITASESPDGTTWTRIGVTTWPLMGNSLFIGISVSSKNAQTTSTAVFENLQIIPGGPG